MALLTSVLLAVLAVCKAHAALDIIPGATWTATGTGKPVQAHGAGIIEVDGTYYMIGEDKTHGALFENVNCYSSKDLVEWTYEGALLSRTDEDGDLGPNRIVERPKVIYNDKTGKYVMYFHADSTDYEAARVGVATSDTVCGKYTYHHSFRPLNRESRDIGLFKDENGSAYLLTEDRTYGTRIMALRGEDYLNVTNITFGFEGTWAESPAMLKKDGYYFIFGSKLTSWDSNDNTYSYAKSLSGPWSDWTTFAPVGSGTHHSQVTYILPLGSSNAIYMGDRWHGKNLASSTYIWLPLTFDGTKVTLEWRDSWRPDLSTGTWSERTKEASLEGEAASLENGAVAIWCSQCSGGQSVGYIGGDKGGTVTFKDVQSSSAGRKTITIKFDNGYWETRFANVTVNGKSQTLAFKSTKSRWWEAGSASLHCDLKKGSNTIVVSMEDGSWGPDVDRILVPTD
ncbi:hypothetical protein BFJ68_g15980 [Fusarium oxysporum]|uniref:Uncharacterized protein n=1 Tax=Fusarium oxysporum TaxID=5507 RepID=A0A420NMP3_FUSOX|nr:hypothetical protein BFJ71_g15578 [Fusarium oxysporum]RKK92176.1 hypothetical protein BFJ68_g15980 [Fusarium oxysporum]